MANLRKVPTKNGHVYYLDYTFEGRRYVKSTRTSNKELATRILRDIQGKIASGRFDLGDYNRKNISVSNFFEEYFKAAKGQKKAHTIVNERNYAKKFMSFVGNINLRSIDLRLLDQWKSHSLSTVSPTTFNIERRMLQAAFQVAVKWNYLKTNPFKEVEKVKPQEKRLFMQGGELKKIFDLIDDDLKTLRVTKHKVFLHRFRLLLIFLLNTGLRRNEALRLQPRDIERTCSRFHVEHSKSGLVRTIPLNRPALFVLDQLDEQMFSGMNKEHVSRKFSHYVKKASLTGFKLHSLRHTFATNLVSAGVDIYKVSQLLGHSDIRTTLIYAKLEIETLRSGVEKLEENGIHCYNLVTTGGVIQENP
jgi:integrase